MNIELEYEISQAKLSALTKLVNKLAMMAFYSNDVSARDKSEVSALMESCHYAGMQEQEAFDRANGNMIPCRHCGKVESDHASGQQICIGGMGTRYEKP